MKKLNVKKGKKKKRHQQPTGKSTRAGALIVASTVISQLTQHVQKIKKKQR